MIGSTALQLSAACHVTDQAHFTARYYGTIQTAIGDFNFTKSRSCDREKVGV